LKEKQEVVAPSGSERRGPVRSPQVARRGV